MEEARIKMVGDESWRKENLISAMTRLVKENGLLNSFNGLPAMLSKQVFFFFFIYYYLFLFIIYF
jgi:hypothetical protein